MVSLVTGGAGFIGSHVADALVSKGHNVVVLDDLSGGYAENVNPKATFVRGDICDYNLVKPVFVEHRIDFVFHLAAYAAEGLSHFIKRFNYTNNLLGSVNLINQSVVHKIKCFVFTSSIAVYGKNQLPMTEETVPHPEDSYGIAKSAVEQELKITNAMFGLNFIIFRPHNVYGERQNIGDKYRNVIGIFMNEILQNKPLTVFGDGEQTRAFSYIADVAPVIADSIDVVEAYNEIFNIGADIPYSINQLLAEVERAMGTDAEVRYLEPRNEVVHAYASHRKVEQVFRKKAQWTLEEGLRNMARWVKHDGAKSTKHFADIEITEKLPPSWLS